jgi:hypothetical protein
MSVGHIARLLEENKIPTIITASKVFEKQLQAMHLPRVLLTSNMMGRPLGKPFDKTTHKNIILKGLNLLDKAQKSGTMENYASKNI